MTSKSMTLVYAKIMGMSVCVLDIQWNAGRWGGVGQGAISLLKNYQSVMVPGLQNDPN